MIDNELEEQLREEMRHANSWLSMPAGLVRKARRDQRRRIVSRTSAVSAVAAVAVAGAVILSNGTTGASRNSGIDTTAYVVKHVESAVNAVNEIAYMHETSQDTSTGVSPMDVWAYDGSQGQAFRVEVFSPADGQPDENAGTTVTPTNYATYTVVDPIHKTWYRQQAQQQSDPIETGCVLSQATSWSSYPEIAAGLREDLACGALASEGTQRVDGINALKLVSVQRTMTTTIWVDPATYLPVRLTAQVTGAMNAVPWSFDFQWLPPTSANLALLTVQIPSGYTRIKHCCVLP